MDIILYIYIFIIGVAIGLIIGLILWLKQLSDDMTKFNIEIDKLQGKLDALKEQTDKYDSK